MSNESVKNFNLKLDMDEILVRDDSDSAEVLDLVIFLSFSEFNEKIIKLRFYFIFYGFHFKILSG